MSPTSYQTAPPRVASREVYRAGRSHFDGKACGADAWSSPTSVATREISAAPSWSTRATCSPTWSRSWSTRSLEAVPVLHSKIQAPGGGILVTADLQPSDDGGATRLELRVQRCGGRGQADSARRDQAVDAPADIDELRQPRAPAHQGPDAPRGYDLGLVKEVPQPGQLRVEVGHERERRPVALEVRPFAGDGVVGHPEVEAQRVEREPRLFEAAPVALVE